MLEPISVEACDLRGLRKRERKKREGVLEPMYLEARELTRSVFLRTLMERERKRGMLDEKEKGTQN